MDLTKAKSNLSNPKSKRWNNHRFICENKKISQTFFGYFFCLKEEKLTRNG